MEMAAIMAIALANGYVSFYVSLLAFIIIAICTAIPYGGREEDVLYSSQFVIIDLHTTSMKSRSPERMNEMVAGRAARLAGLHRNYHPPRDQFNHQLHRGEQCRQCRSCPDGPACAKGQGQYRQSAISPFRND